MNHLAISRWLLIVWTIISEEALSYSLIDLKIKYGVNPIRIRAMICLLVLEWHHKVNKRTVLMKTEREGKIKKTKNKKQNYKKKPRKKTYLP